MGEHPWFSMKGSILAYILVLACSLWTAATVAVASRKAHNPRVQNRARRMSSTEACQWTLLRPSALSYGCAWSKPEGLSSRPNRGDLSRVDRFPQHTTVSVGGSILGLKPAKPISAHIVGISIAAAHRDHVLI